MMKINLKCLIENKKLASQNGAIAVEFAMTIFIAIAIIFLFIDMLLIMISMNVQQAALSASITELKVMGVTKSIVEKYITDTINERQFGYVDPTSISIKSKFYATLRDASDDVNRPKKANLSDYPILRVDVEYKYEFKSDVIFGLFDIPSPSVKDTFFVRMETK